MPTRAWRGRGSARGLARVCVAAWLGAAGALAAEEVTKELREQAEQFARFALFDKAAEAYTKLLASKPDDPALRLALADALCKDRRFADADRECMAVIQGNATPEQKALAQACLGDLARKQGKTALARRAYEAAKETAADLPGALPDAARARARRALGLLDWAKAEARKVVVYFPPDSPAKSSAEGTARFLDSRVAVIERFSKRPFAGKLEVYLFSTPEQWESILGKWDWEAQAAQEKTVHMMAGRTFYNLMRTLSFYLGNAAMKEVPKATFIANGFAGAYCGSKTWSARIQRQTAEMKRQGSIPRLADLLKSTSQNNTTVALGASFVAHLTKTYGEEKFVELWNAFNEEEGALPRVYGKPLDRLEDEWLQSIR